MPASACRCRAAAGPGRAPAIWRSTWHAAFDAQIQPQRRERGRPGGPELAARAGYDPQAAVTWWQKMGQATATAAYVLSVHPPHGPDRIRELEQTCRACRGCICSRAVDGQAGRLIRPVRVGRFLRRRWWCAIAGQRCPALAQRLHEQVGRGADMRLQRQRGKARPARTGQIQRLPCSACTSRTAPGRPWQSYGSSAPAATADFL